MMVTAKMNSAKMTNTKPAAQLFRGLYTRPVFLMPFRTAFCVEYMDGCRTQCSE